MIYAILAGAAAGIISGMGMGGGTILIPILIFCFNVDQQTAQCINLLFFIPTAIISLIVHISKKMIDFKNAYPIILYGITGALIGSYFAVSLPSDILRKVFAVFLILIGINEFFRGNKGFVFKKH